MDIMVNYQDNNLSMANANSTQIIANYNFNQDSFTPAQIYTGQVVDYGALGAKTAGDDPISGSFDGVFLAKFSPFEYLGSLQYGLTIYQIPEPNLWTNGVGRFGEKLITLRSMAVVTLIAHLMCVNNNQRNKFYPMDGSTHITVQNIIQDMDYLVMLE